MRARSTTVQGNPQNLDKGIHYVSDRVLPAVMGMDGFIGLSMLADRHSGRCIITSAWEDTAALQRSATEVKAMRARAADILGGPATVEAWTIDVLHRLHPISWCHLGGPISMATIRIHLRQGVEDPTLLLHPTLAAEDTTTADSVKATWPKDKLVTRLKASFAFCPSSVSNGAPLITNWVLRSRNPSGRSIFRALKNVITWSIAAIRLSAVANGRHPPE